MAGFTTCAVWRTWRGLTKTFSFRLHSTDLFRRMFKAKFVPCLSSSAEGDDDPTINGPNSVDESDDLNEAERAAMEFIEHGLLNRVNFACGHKKSLLCHCYQHTMEDIHYREFLINLANRELKYVARLLRPLNSDIVERVNRSVSMWLERDVCEVEEDDEDEEDDEMDNDANEVNSVTDEE